MMMHWPPAASGETQLLDCEKSPLVEMDPRGIDPGLVFVSVTIWVALVVPIAWFAKLRKAGASVKGAAGGAGMGTPLILTVGLVSVAVSSNSPKPRAENSSDTGY